MEYCPYSELGCNDYFSSQKEVNHHLQGNNEFHAKLIIDWINNLKNDLQSFLKSIENLKTENENLKSKIRLIEERNSNESRTIQTILFNTKNQIDELNTEIKQMKTKEYEYHNIILILQENNKSKLTEINKLKSQIAILNKNWENFTPQIGQTIESNKNLEINVKKNTAIFESNNQKLFKLNDNYNQLITDQTNFRNSMNLEILKIKEFLQSFNYGEFVWKITNFNYNENCITSDIFLSHKNGYSIQLILYPRGRESGLNTHLSVHFSIIPGPYDDILPWPIRNEIKISLINQSTGREHCQKIFKLSNTPKGYQNIFNKPINNYTQTYGSEQFISLIELISNESLSKNNTIYLKCSLRFP